MKKYYIIALTFFFCSVIAQQKKKHFALIGGIAHVGNGKVIEGAIIAVNNGTIEMVMPMKGFKLSPSSYDTVIDLEGKHVYPSMINPNNTLGLHDAEAVRATRDFAEIGTLNPHIRSLIAYNTDNQIVPTIKTNGVLYTQCTPRSGLISGSSSIMALEGWNWEDAVLKADDGIHVNFPRMAEKKIEGEPEPATPLPPAAKRYADEMGLLNKFFMDAIAYNLMAKPEEKNIRLEAMKPVLNGKANLYLHADKAKDILSAINFCIKYKIARPVIVGAREAYKVTRELKKYHVPVILNRVHDLPERPDEAVDLAYATPNLLDKDSILFCLDVAGDMESAQSRNLPFNAGTAAAYGMAKEKALQLITLNAAKILGVDKWIGSLEEGKLASIIVSTGDILDMRTNKITAAWIAGKPVNLNNKQSDLYNRYKNKYGIK
jgi:imidazolonepropionase-like amidohydrolase